MRARAKRFRFALWVAALVVLEHGAHADPVLRNPPAVPTVVQVGFYLSDINDISEQNENFEFEGRLISSWKDPRVAFDPAVAGVSVKTYTGSYQFTEIFAGWWPQLVLANESGHFEQQGVILKVEADGSLRLVQEITAVAEMPLDLHHFPFDQQGFIARFLVLGYEEKDVRLEADLESTGRDDSGVQIAQWHLVGIEIEAERFRPHLEGEFEPVYSGIAVRFEMDRRPEFMLRIIVFPLTLLCLLCASVFWMDHESLGDRMTISFTGLLTVVAYQFMVSGSLPTIAYFTLMDGFVYTTYGFIAATIVINLRVDHLNRTGRQDVGDRLDERCRWIFPLGFFGSNAAIALAFFLV